MRDFLMLKAGKSWENQDKLVTLDFGAIWFLSCLYVTSQASFPGRLKLYSKKIIKDLLVEQISSSSSY